MKTSSPEATAPDSGLLLTQELPQHPNSTVVPALRIGLLGCGTVGSEVVRLILEDGHIVEQCTGTKPTFVSALVRDVQRDRGLRSEWDGGRLTDDFDVFRSTKPDVVIEVLGGIEPARTYVAAMLNAGIGVVSANKSLVAEHGSDLAHLAAQRGAFFAYEAAICAAAPVLDAAQQFRGEPIDRVAGILNGTCNAILTQMERDNSSIEEAIADAQRRGLAEPNPEADLSGRDSAEKLIILTRALGWEHARPSDVRVRGIGGVTASDIRFARRRGYALRLVATLEHATSMDPVLRVEPTLLLRSHRLASLNGAENGIAIESVWRGEVFFSGIGAGPRPTAAAIIGDALRVMQRSSCAEPRAIGRSLHRAAEHSALKLPASGWYMRIDRAAGGSLKRCLNAFRAHDIELVDIEWRENASLILTKPTDEAAIERLLETIVGGQSADVFLARVPAIMSRTSKWA